MDIEPNEKSHKMNKKRHRAELESDSDVSESYNDEFNTT